eukprot:GHVO01050624.1.p1 GENE.GHVO01050624.1~~GHVO01050624.1.p1  ORF type:complete len:461 (+),score=55.48 GHVO01050624.1:873-2255(+)
MYVCMRKRMLPSNKREGPKGDPSNLKKNRTLNEEDMRDGPSRIGPSRGDAETSSPERRNRAPSKAADSKSQADEGTPNNETSGYTPSCKSSPADATESGPCTLEGCRGVDNFRKLNEISEGTFGAVFRAEDRTTKEIVALKQVKYIERLWEEGFPMPVLREISILLALDHRNVINVKEVVVGKTQHHVYMVMEYVEHELKVLLEENKPAFSLSEKKSLLQQLLRGLTYLHSNWVVHRDIKTTNLLYSNSGVLKICDFGSSRKFADPIEPYSRNVVTLWYRAPELLLGKTDYDEAVDVWSAGCVFAELLLRRPLFKSSNEAETLGMIFNLCGTPTSDSWPEFSQLPLAKSMTFATQRPSWRKTFAAPSTGHAGRSGELLSDTGLHLLQRMLDLNPATRIKAHEALKHPYIVSEKPTPRSSEWMPTVPDTNTQGTCSTCAHYAKNYFHIKSSNVCIYKIPFC